MRKIIISDAIDWLKESPQQNCSMIASMPDYSEFPNHTIDEWKNWFLQTAELIIEKTSDHGVSIFYQSDIKYKGTWIDKSYICQKAAENKNSKLLWHKIICRVPPGNITFGRPAYSHILCFSKSLKLDHRKSSADVISHVGEKLWERGMGIEACVFIAKFLKEQVQSELIINPFCGQGSIISVLEAFDLPSIGIERSSKRGRHAEKIKFNLENKTWY
jgi:hypothetical protein